MRPPLKTLKLKGIHALPQVFHKDIYNALANLSHYRLTPRPRHVHFEITYRCSCRCVFCSRWSVGPQKVADELTTKEILQFLEDAVRLGVVGISFSGGEPFIREDILEIASYCKRLGLFVHVSSNGTLISQENCNQINRLFDSILISVDSHIPDIHDNLRGVSGAYAKAMRALKLLDKSKTMVQMVVNAMNIDDLYEYVAQMAQVTDRIRLQPLHRNPANLLVLEDERIGDLKDITSKWNAFTQRLRESNLKLFGSPRYYDLVPRFLSEPEKLAGKTDCFMGSHAFFLDPYGNVVPCEGIREPFGNIREEKLSRLWRAANPFRRMYNRKSTRPCTCLYTCLEGDILFWYNFFSIRTQRTSFP